MAEEIKGLEFEKPIIELEERILNLRNPGPEETMDHSGEIKALEEKLDVMKNQIYGSLSTWQRVQFRKAPKTPVLSGLHKAHAHRFYRASRRQVFHR